MTGPYGEDPTRAFRAWIPIDDDNTLVFGATYHPNRPLRDEARARLEKGGGVYNVGENGFLPANPEIPWSQWRPKQNITKDFWNDYPAQKSERWCGIPSTWAQDSGMQETMGPINDRTTEHLVSTDIGIIQMRHWLIAAARSSREGEAPASVDDPALFAVRAAAMVLPKCESWVEATAKHRRALQALNSAGPERPQAASGGPRSSRGRKRGSVRGCEVRVPSKLWLAAIVLLATVALAGCRSPRSPSTTSQTGTAAPNIWLEE